MSTYIMVGVALCFTLALSARNIFRVRKLHGEEPEEWFGNWCSYDPVFSLFFKWLPATRLFPERWQSFPKWRFGSVGSVLLLFVLVPYLLGLLASAVDGTLLPPLDVEGNGYTGFLDDLLFLSIIVGSAATVYIFRSIMNIVPETFLSLFNNIPEERSEGGGQRHR